MKTDDAQTLKGVEAIYLTRVDQIEAARAAFEAFVSHQNEIAKVSPIVSGGSRLIAALNEYDVDREDAISLRRLAIDVCIHSLESLRTTDSKSFDALIQDDGLAALKESAEFQDRVR